MKTHLLLGSCLACLALAGTTEAQMFRGRGNVNPGYQNSYYYPQPGAGYYQPGYYGQPGYGYQQGYFGQPGYGYGPGWSGNSGYVSQNGAQWSNQGYPGWNNQAFQGQAQNEALIHVLVPLPNAQVTFEGQQTQQQGTHRLFISPPLQGSSQFTYKIRASWQDNGQTVHREKTVQLQPGRETTVSFMENRGENQGDLQNRQGQPVNQGPATPQTQPNERRNQTPQPNDTKRQPPSD